MASEVNTERKVLSPSEPGRSVVWPLVLYAALAAMALLTLVPIVWMVLTSFKSSPELAANPPTWWPREWHPENYTAAWNFAPFGHFLINSAIMVGGITVLQVATSAAAAYAFARLNFRGRDLLFLLYLATLMIPPQVIVIPQFIIVKDLDWVDTYQGLIIPQAFTAFGVFLLRQFFIGIPKELEDAARVDGATRFGSFFRIILPLSGPAIAALAAFIFMFHWNNLLWPLVVSNTDATTPIVVGLRNFQGQRGTEWNLLMAAAGIASVPVVAFFLMTQRWFVQGITMSGFGGR